VLEHRQRTREYYLREHAAGTDEVRVPHQVGLVQGEADPATHLVAHGPTLYASVHGFVQWRESVVRTHPWQGPAPRHATEADARCLPVEWCMLILRELHNTGLRQWLSCRKNFLRHLSKRRLLRAELLNVTSNGGSGPQAVSL
jgi:hypothetical protein